MNIRKFYIETYPKDRDLGKQLRPISFGRLYRAIQEGEGVYGTMGVVDSVVRERLFLELSEQLGVKYKVVYKLWLDNVK